MTREKDSRRRYLHRHAEPEVTDGQILAASVSEPNNPFRHCVVIPAYDESPVFLQTLRRRDDEALLVIVVINQPDSGPASTANKDLYQWALASGPVIGSRGNLQWIQWPGHKQLLVVDRFSPGCQIPAKQGVGTARKIGCDLALALGSAGILTADFIHSTDADAQLPPDYFQTARATGREASALVYPFQHQSWETNPPTDAVRRATALYEESLDYYVTGLRWAGSPYAFHTIGSCLAVSPHHYAMAHGFPKRDGGEDFYLLNKLAKLAPVKTLESTPLQIQPRRSDRVPFGTGPAVEKILSQEEPPVDYDPRIFAHLQQLLQAFNKLPGCVNTDEAGTEKTDTWLAELPDISRAALAELGVGELLTHLSRLRRPVQQLAHIHQWFDAFRTLKYIHYLQDHGFPPTPLSRAPQDLQRLMAPAEPCQWNTVPEID